MAFHQQCPACQKRMKVPDNLSGKDLRCPACGNSFRASPATGPLAAGQQPLPGWFADMLDGTSPVPADVPQSDDSGQFQHADSRALEPAPFVPPEDLPPEPWYYRWVRIIAYVNLVLGVIAGIALAVFLGLINSAFFGSVAGTVTYLVYAVIVILAQVSSSAWALVLLEFFTNFRAIRYHITRR